MANKDPKAAAAVDAADDLDDLDDILDEFNAPAAADAKKEDAAQQSASQSAAASKPSAATKEEGAAAGEAEGDEETEDELNARFARELQEGMEALMKGGLNPAAAAGLADSQGAADEQDGDPLMNEDEMMRQFEQMMAEMGFGAPSGSGGGEGAAPKAATGSAAGSSSAPSQPPANFQEAIRNTMSRLRESDQTATSSAGQANEFDFEKLMSALGSADGGAEGGEEGIAQMLESMMGELMSKEVLYEPLKELEAKYPGYLANPPAPLSDEDRTRYVDQQRILKGVLAAFDDPKFENGTDAEKQALKTQVQSLMTEMQDSGSPPQEIIGDLPPELEGMPGLNDGTCTVM